MINSSTMMRGFVSATYARIVSPVLDGRTAGASAVSPSAARSPAGSTRAATANATTVAQINADMATWVARAQVASSVRTLAPPTSTWRTSSTRATVDSRTRRDDRGVIVRARTIVQVTSATTTIASIRWANIATAPGRERSGTRLWPIRGHSWNASPAFSART